MWLNDPSRTVCQRKKRYLSKGSATEAVHRLRRRDPHDPRKDDLNAYYCANCRGYHVGHWSAPGGSDR